MDQGHVDEEVADGGNPDEPIDGADLPENVADGDASEGDETDDAAPEPGT